ncbi:MAG: cobalamin biosynthesis protein [Deltaproteobacteria bacterium]|nr:cobalamin biosynthesis protein [Deltaproteobacteria bacterium]
MKVALISLSAEGARLLRRLAPHFPEARIFLHDKIRTDLEGKRFGQIILLIKEIFTQFDGLVFVMPTGVVVRAVAPLIKHKTRDPAVVVVDVGGRFAISLLSGHEGGANDLAVTVGNILGAEPVVTTTTEALKQVIVGVGCRKGVSAGKILQAIETALAEAGVKREEIRWLASADVKAEEAGLIQAAQALGVPLRLVDSEEIRRSSKPFQHSEFVQEKVNVPAVAEAAALLAGRRTRLILPKKAGDGVTVALARENFLWSESAPEDR